MEKEKESFVFYETFKDTIDALDNIEERLEMYEMIVAYGLYGEIKEPSNKYLSVIFVQMQHSIDKAKERRNTYRENGKKGGAPVGNTNASKNKQEQPKTTKNKQEQPKTTQNNLNGNVYGNGNVDGDVLVKKTKAKKETIPNIVKANLNNENEIELFNALLEVRNKLKVPNTERAVKMLLNKLNGLSEETKERQLIIEQSVIGGWKSVFPFKENKIDYKQQQAPKAEYNKVVNDYVEER